MPNVDANCLANSVFPTPVGPTNKNEPIGLSGSWSPALESFMALATCLTAESWPNTFASSPGSRSLRFPLSSTVTDLGGTFAIRAMVFSTSSTVTIFFPANLAAAPHSSMTSMALSGNLDSRRWFAANFAASLMASGSNLTP